PLLLEMGRPIYGHVFDGYWQDIGNLDQYRQANFDALDESVRLEIEGIRIRGNVWLGDGVDLDDLEAIEGPAYLGNYCRIARGAHIGPYTVLSSSVTVRERGRVVRSIVDTSTYVGRSTDVVGAIVGRSCDLRAHVRVHEGAAIGDEVTVGAEVIRIQFFEPPGVEMSAAMQKEVEKHFTRGEFRRVAAGEVGNISYPARVPETYAAELLSTIDADAVRDRRFRIVVDYGFSGASYVLPLVLGPLGVEVVAA